MGSRNADERTGAFAGLNERLRQMLRERQWSIVIFAWLTASVLGYLGFLAIAETPGETAPPYLLYRTLQLFALKSGDIPGHVPLYFEIARWLAPAVAAFVAGKGLSVLFYRQFQYVRASRLRNHVIICGLSYKGCRLAEAFLAEKSQRVVVIERDSSSRSIRGARGDGALVLEGDARQRSVLRAAGANRARLIIAVCDDATNAEVAVQLGSVIRYEKPTLRDRVRRLLGEHRLPIDCMIHNTKEGLTELFEGATDAISGGSLNVRFFNMEISGVRQLLFEHPPFPLAPDDAAAPATMVVGSGTLASRLVIEVAKRWGVRSGLHAGAMTIAVLAPDATAFCNRLKTRFPALERLCTLIPLECTLESVPAMVSTDRGLPSHLGTAYVAMDEDADAVTWALTLDHVLDCETKIVGCASKDEGISSLYSLYHGPNGSRVEPFVLLDKTCASPLLLLEPEIETMAQMLDAEYRRIAGEPACGWSEVPEAFRESSREQARWVHEILKTSGFDIIRAAAGADGKPIVLTEQQIEEMAVIEHQRWLSERLLTGWRLSDNKDAERRLSQYLTPWAQLPAAQRDLTRRLVAFWPEMLANPALGFALAQPAERAAEEAA